MSRLLGVVIAVVATVLAIAVLVPVFGKAQNAPPSVTPLQLLAQAQPASPPASQPSPAPPPAAQADMPTGYVGAETCKGCHEESYTKFARTKMGAALPQGAPQRAGAPRRRELPRPGPRARRGGRRQGQGRSAHERHRRPAGHGDRAVVPGLREPAHPGHHAAPVQLLEAGRECVLHVRAVPPEELADRRPQPVHPRGDVHLAREQVGGLHGEHRRGHARLSLLRRQGCARTSIRRAPWPLS